MRKEELAPRYILLAFYLLILTADKRVKMSEMKPLPLSTAIRTAYVATGPKHNLGLDNLVISLCTQSLSPNECMGIDWNRQMLPLRAGLSQTKSIML